MIEKKITTPCRLNDEKMWKMHREIHGIGGISPAITCHGGERINKNPSENGIKFKNATKQGWIEGFEYDGIVLNFLNRARGRVQNKKSPTIQTDGGGSSGVITMDQEKKEYRVRKLTERECLRLMAYTDDEIDRLVNAKNEKGKPMYSKTALYKFAGNSVVVDCFTAIMGEILKDMEGKSGQTTLSNFLNE